MIPFYLLTTALLANLTYLLWGWVGCFLCVSVLLLALLLYLVEKLGEEAGSVVTMGPLTTLSVHQAYQNTPPLDKPTKLEP